MRPLPQLTGLSYGQMRAVCRSLPVTIGSAVIKTDALGYYDESANAIVIDRRLTYTAKRCTLAHELVHWSNQDSACDPLFHAREEYRTKRETALMLINPLEYASAESVFDGDIYKIADELGVTVQVINDYRAFLENERLKNN